MMKTRTYLTLDEKLTIRFREKVKTHPISDYFHKKEVAKILSKPKKK